MKHLLLTALFTVFTTSAFSQEVSYKGVAKCPEYWHMGEGNCQITFDGKTVYATGKRGSANWTDCKKTGKDVYRCDLVNNPVSRNKSVIVSVGKSPSIRGVDEKL